MKHENKIPVCQICGEELDTREDGTPYLLCDMCGWDNAPHDDDEDDDEED